MKRILIIQTASIGDVILATPVLEALHAQLPDYKIDILVKNGMEALFLNHPFLNDILVWNKSRHKYLNLFHLIGKIRSRHYSYVITLQRFFSSGLLTYFSGSKVTIGFEKNPLSMFFRYRLPHEICEGVHETERNLSLLAPLEIRHQKPVLRLYPSPQDFQRVKNYKKQNYITISPASLWFTKQFPVKGWIDFLDCLPDSLQVYILGSKQDLAIANQLISDSKHSETHSLCGELKFLESAALMKDAVMNYTNDSAPLHLASAVDAPLTAIFCSTTPDFGFGPLAKNATVVETRDKLNCRPCGLHGWNACPKGHFKCGINIDSAQLLMSLPK